MSEEKVEKITPYDGEEAKTGQVRRMFDSIAPAYDTMNRLMTLGIDRRWRRKTVAEAVSGSEGVVAVGDRGGDVDGVVGPSVVQLQGVGRGSVQVVGLGAVGDDGAGVEAVGDARLVPESARPF